MFSDLRGEVYGVARVENTDLTQPFILQLRELEFGLGE